MSLSPAQVRIIANTEPFQSALARAVQLLTDFEPLLRKIALRRRRHQIRVVTRNKQRRNW